MLSFYSVFFSVLNACLVFLFHCILVRYLTKDALPSENLIKLLVLHWTFSVIYILCPDVMLLTLTYIYIYIYNIVICVDIYRVLDD